MAATLRPDHLFKQIAFLKEVPLFTDIDEGILAYLSQDFRIREYRRGDIIFHQGDTSRSLLIVMQGKVRVYHLSPGGEETTVTLLARRHLLGEFALIDGHPRSATAQAITNCTLLEMPGERCLHHLEQIPGLALAMCRTVVQKTRWTSLYAETLARFDAAGRLLHFLLLYNEEFGQAQACGVSVLDLGLNQSDLATLVGARRGWINHILQEWRKRGLLEFNAGQITILDLARAAEERDSRMQAPCVEA